MAKKPRNYPILPRVPRERKLRGSLSVNETKPVKYDKLRRADWYIKSTKTYYPDWLNAKEVVTIGSNVKAGVKNPGWKVKIATGTDATSNYSRSGWRVTPTTYGVITESTVYRSRGYGTYYGDVLVNVGSFTALQDRALARIKNKLNGKVGNARLGPPLAESREIGRLVRQINGLGMTAFRALLAAKATKGKSVTKTASDIWLGFGFGVNPLLQDVKHAADAILHYVTRESHRVVVSSAATDDYVSGYPAPKTYSAAGEAIAYSTKIGFSSQSYHKRGVRYGAAYDLQIGSGSSYNVADHLGLKVSALPSILWELTPYSWAVDYFTTVGSWLDDTFYTVPGTCVYAWLTQKYECEGYAYPMAIADSGAGLKTTLSGSATKVRYFSFSRSKLAGGLPARELRIKSVDEIANHGITKLLNLGAVIAGRRGPKL